jgi:hypothetical protein
MNSDFSIAGPMMGMCKWGSKHLRGLSFVPCIRFRETPGIIRRAFRTQHRSQVGYVHLGDGWVFANT